MESLDLVREFLKDLSKLSERDREKVALEIKARLAAQGCERDAPQRGGLPQRAS